MIQTGNRSVQTHQKPSHAPGSAVQALAATEQVVDDDDEDDWGLDASSLGCRCG